ncbi:MAG: nitrogen fixation-related uncharacterized protein [Natronomonas sp.]|jgi:nitrogen fixation-related uncharacterized protein|uniref:hypothetical protein n=1 Tax=Natronomonas sp. TaxID=2184060 RepID=UPI003988C147
MIPLQAAIDPVMAVVLLSIVMVFVIIFGFIWAFENIQQEPEIHDEDEELKELDPGHGV